MLRYSICNVADSYNAFVTTTKLHGGLTITEGVEKIKSEFYPNLKYSLISLYTYVLFVLTNE